MQRCAVRGAPWEATVDFDELVTVRGTALLRFALMLCGDPSQAQDLVQAVLVKAYRQWARVARADHPEAYLKAMIVNEQLSWWRRRASREVPIPTHHDPAITDSADAYAERDAAWAMLGRLGKRQRAVLALCYHEEPLRRADRRWRALDNGTRRATVTQTIIHRTLQPLHVGYAFDGALPQ